MHAQGVMCVMLTGDNARTGNGVGRSLGVSHVYAEMLPADKVDKVGSKVRMFLTTESVR